MKSTPSRSSRRPAQGDSAPGRSVRASTGYEFIEHTADAGLWAWGPNPRIAFAEAARGMFALMLGHDPSWLTVHGISRSRDIEVTAADWPALLVAWLSEFIFYFDLEGYVPIEIAVDHCEPPSCSAHMDGICLDNSEDAIGIGVKAVTYHQLEVEVRPERTSLRVIFDV
jgi:SHS2 domain-containing protein